MAPRNNTEDIPVLTPYNPLDKRHLGEQVAEALLAQDVQPLPPSRFIGAGVYALYYIGDFSAYAALADVNKMTSSFVLSMWARPCRKAREKAVREKTSILGRRYISGSTIMRSLSTQLRI